MKITLDDIFCGWGFHTCIWWVLNEYSCLPSLPVTPMSLIDSANFMDYFFNTLSPLSTAYMCMGGGTGTTSWSQSLKNTESPSYHSHHQLPIASHFRYLFQYWWALRLIPYLGYYGECHNKHVTLWAGDPFGCLQEVFLNVCQEKQSKCCFSFSVVLGTKSRHCQASALLMSYIPAWCRYNIGGYYKPLETVLPSSW